MKEIVINACYGGFGLSPIAISEYLKLLNKKVYFYKQIKHDYQDGVKEYMQVDKLNNDLFIYSVLKDFGEQTSEIYERDMWFDANDIARDDSNLITIIKQLGDKASGSCANLKIVEIPDDVIWEIEEYDGFEHVAEKHRIWE